MGPTDPLNSAPMTHENIVSTFDSWAQNGRAEGMEEGHGDVVRQVISQLEIRPGMQSLDLGCGSGWATRLLASSAPGAGAVGVDASPEMIARAEAGHDLTSRARYEVCTFEALDLPDNRFDRVFSMEALYYAVDLPKALAEVFRVTKASGRCDIVVDRFKESPLTERWEATCGVAMHFLSEAEWKEAVEAAGYHDVTCTRVIDSRGPGSEEDFKASAHLSSWQEKVELHEAGSLWIQGVKPA